MKISVIICTYNREKYIYNVLKSLAENDYSHSDYEIVLVDNNCTDNTAAECQRFKQDFPDVNFQYRVETSQGLSYARNNGITHAKGEILVYVDDDALVNKEYLRSYAEFFDANSEAVAAGGAILPIYEGKVEPKWMSHYTRQLLTAKLFLGDEQRKFPKGKFPGGGNAAYRKSVFHEVGLFNVELGRKGSSLLSAEEKDLFDKMVSRGMSFYYLPTAILYHIIPDQKLQREYFEKLTLSIGRSERMRTKAISNKKYFQRIVQEAIKWGGTLALWTGFALKLQFAKGNKLVRFRYNVTRGLLGK